MTQRPIKFRARPSGSAVTSTMRWGESWAYSELDEAAFWLQLGRKQLNRETLGQFTGLHDKNGKEIWEGDVVTCEEPDFESEMVEGQIVFDDGIFWVERNGETAWPINAFNHGKQLEVIGNIYEVIYEVIGNIYENPELLNQ